VITKADAIHSLYPTAKAKIVGNSEIEWLSTDIPQPSDAEIEAEVARLQQEYEKNEYQRQRAVEYPRLEEQLDYIYHYGVDAWKTDIIDPVKNKYPKSN